MVLAPFAFFVRVNHDPPPRMPPQLPFDISGIDLNRVIYDQEQIRASNPQRGDMKMLNGIVYANPEQGRIIGFKDVRADEFWVPGHIAGRPLFTGVLMLEPAPQIASLNLQNPNPLALPISKADYKLGLGGVNVLEGKAKPDGTLPANGNLDVKLPVTITFENLLAAEKAITSGGGNLPYAFSGNMDFDT